MARQWARLDWWQFKTNDAYLIYNSKRMSKAVRLNNRVPSRSLLVDHKNRLPLKSTKKGPVPNLNKARVGENVQVNRSKSIVLVSRVASPVTVAMRGQGREGCCRSEEETKVCEWQSREQRSELPQWGGQLGQYRKEITEYIVRREGQFLVDAGYIRHSRVVSGKMRVYLVRHLFKMYLKFQLMRTTIHLAVLYLDLYLARHPMLQDQLEAVAAAQACLFIAMKFEEIYPPDLEDWVERRHRQDVLKLEAAVLKALDYQLAHSTVEHQLALRLWEDGVTTTNDKMELLADLSLFDLNIRQLRPSEIAAGIVGTVRKEGGNEGIVLSLKWMVERNPESLHWLCDQKYRGLLGTYP